MTSYLHNIKASAKVTTASYETGNSNILETEFGGLNDSILLNNATHSLSNALQQTRVWQHYPPPPENRAPNKKHTRETRWGFPTQKTVELIVARYQLDKSIRHFPVQPVHLTVKEKRQQTFSNPTTAADHRRYHVHQPPGPPDCPLEPFNFKNFRYRLWRPSSTDQEHLIVLLGQ